MFDNKGYTPRQMKWIPLAKKVSETKEYQLVKDVISTLAEVLGEEESAVNFALRFALNEESREAGIARAQSAKVQPAPAKVESAAANTPDISAIVAAVLAAMQGQNVPAKQPTYAESQMANTRKGLTRKTPVK